MELLWSWLTTLGIADPGATPPKVNISAIVSGGISAAGGDSIEVVGRDAGSVLRTLKTLTDGTLLVLTAAPTTLQYGRQTVAVTGTAVQLPSQALTGAAGAVVQALAANAGTVVIGDSAVTTANGMQLQAGQATGVNIDNLNRLYVNGNAGDGVCWIGT